MKKTLILSVFAFLLYSGFAATTPTLPAGGKLDATSIMIPVGKDGASMSLYELAYIKPREFAKASNRKMNFFDRASFSIAQKKLRNSINKDGTIDNKKMTKLVSALDGETGFHLGGFALGFLLGLIGVLIAYIINDDYKSNRRKWAWIGLGSFLIIYLVLVLVAA